MKYEIITCKQNIIILQDEFEKRIIERDSHEEALGDDVSRNESDNIIFLDVVGGVNKKGRIYGLTASYNLILNK